MVAVFGCINSSAVEKWIEAVVTVTSIPRPHPAGSSFPLPSMLPIILVLPGLFGLARGVGFYGEVCFEEDVPQANFEGGQCHEMTLSPDYRISLTDGGLKGLSLVPKGLAMTDENVLAGKVRVKDKRLGGTRSLRATIKLDGSIEELSKGETEKAYKKMFGYLVGEWRKRGSEDNLDGDEEGSDEREEENSNEETKLILTERDMERLGMEGKAGPKGVTIKSNYQLGNQRSRRSIHLNVSQTDHVRQDRCKHMDGQDDAETPQGEGKPSQARIDDCEVGHL
ncbi:hypothetical protein FOZ60_015860 [Perkinsus olseni]|uniref:Uncharacterized protein n=1 Tax=Perkinsus olseni TaxID=32597 RepID=A0A7J6N7T2_PEROL|nr:hypothetical protein FOZ60_015860 [Perkinsus olseni]